MRQGHDRAVRTTRTSRAHGRLVPFLAAVAAGIGLAACSSSGAQPPVAPVAPPEEGKRLVSERGMVSSAHPAASEAGVEMLRRGGNAVDAAVATAFTVGVGEPQMSGLGGGGSMLIWLDGESRAEYVDFYAAGRAETFRGLPPSDSTTPLRVVGIPGEVAGLLEAHERFGRLTRQEVMEPAIRLAEEGFPVNQILAQMIARDSAKLSRYPETRRILLPDGEPIQPGERLRFPELAETLRTIAREGRAGFYEGDVARRVVERLNEGGHPATMDDLAGYTPRWKRPLCEDYRGMAVLSAAPPQTGLQVIHTLNLLEPHDVGALGLPTRSARAFDVLTSALRVGMTGNRHNGDPNWTTVPANGVASDAYAEQRANLVATGRVAPELDDGDPVPFDGASPASVCAPLEPYGPAPTAAAAASEAPDEEDGTGETTHLSVVDADGNAVSLTRTNSSLFGSGARAAGFFLNNSGFDFEDSPDAEGRSEWRVRRSTISPTIVLEDGAVRLVVGAPGGGRIPTAIVQTMVYHLDYGLDPLEAVSMPRIFPSASARRVQLENGFSAEVLGAVRGMEWEPAALSFGYARLYVIARQGELWVGAADPRHNGEVRGY